LEIDFESKRGEVRRMPIYPKKTKTVGYVIGDKVWCEHCWKEKRSEEPGESITEKDLKKNEYICDSCGGTLPVNEGYRFNEWLKDNREEIKEMIRKNIEQTFPTKGGETD
jgi:transposase-like protein